MSKKEQSSAAFGYLVAYNAAQTVGWSFILVWTLNFYYKHRTIESSFEYVEFWLGLLQTAAFLEVVHCITGLVRSNPFLTFIQILSRVVVYWGVLKLVPETREQLGLPMLMVAWCIAEITRYAFYFATLFNNCPGWLTWCRYSFFLVLYPTGVTGELLAIFTAVPIVEKKSLLSFSLPNKLNFSFHYHLLLIFVMLTYIPGFPQMYGHMLKQRSKVLHKKND